MKIEGFGGDGDFEEEAPVPLLPPEEIAQDYPVEAFGDGFLAKAINGIVDVAQVPPAIAAQSVLAAAALVVQPFVNIVLPTRQVRPVVLYLTTLADSSDRKSTSDDLAISGVLEFQQGRYPAYNEAMIEHTAALEAHKVRIARTKGKDKSAEDTRQDMIELGAEPKPPKPPTLLVKKGTMQGLVELFVRGSTSLGLFSSEGGSWFGGYGLKEENRLHTAATLSEFWDGSAIEENTKGGGFIYLMGRRLSFHMMIQPGVADDIFSNPILRDQGFLNRLLVAAPHSLAGTRFHRDPRPSSFQDIDHFKRRLVQALGQSPKVDQENGGLILDNITMTEEAQKMWWAFSDHIEAKIGPKGEWRTIKGMTGKLAEQAARLATVIAVFQNGRLKTVEEGLSATDLSRGVKLAEFYASEFVRLIERPSVTPLEKNAEIMRAWLVDSHKKPIVALSTLSQLAPRTVRGKANALAAMEMLESARHVVKLSGGTVIDGKRAKDAWRVRGIEAE